MTWLKMSFLRLFQEIGLRLWRLRPIPPKFWKRPPVPTSILSGTKMEGKLRLKGIGNGSSTKLTAYGLICQDSRRAEQRIEEWDELGNNNRFPTPQALRTL